MKILLVLSVNHPALESAVPVPWNAMTGVLIQVTTPDNLLQGNVALDTIDVAALSADLSRDHGSALISLLHAQQIPTLVWGATEAEYQVMAWMELGVQDYYLFHPEIAHPDLLSHRLKQVWLMAQAHWVAEGIELESDSQRQKDTIRAMAASLLKTEASLQQANLEMQSIFEAFPDLFFVLSSDGRILNYKSAQNNQDLYLPPAAFLGKQLIDVFPWDLSKSLLKGIAQIQAGEALYSLTYPLELSQRQQWFEARLVPLVGSSKVVASIRNITALKQAEEQREAALEDLRKLNQELEQRVEARTTELTDANHRLQNTLSAYRTLEMSRKQAEKRLQESQHFIQRLTDASPDILYLFDLSLQRIIYINNECERSLGYSAFELKARGLKLLHDLVYPEDLPRIQQHQQQLISAQSSDILTLEYRLRDQQGNWHWFLSRDGVFLRDEQGYPLQIIGAAADITQRKLYEEKLELANYELARAKRLQDEFLANMSHELRTPLNAILGMSENLLEVVFGKLNDRQIHAVQTIEQSGEHLLAIINDVLDLAKIEAGYLDLNCTPTLIGQLCKTSLNLIIPQAQKKNIQVKLNLDPSLQDQRIELDERRIRQVLVNLLSNAIKFTPSQGAVILDVSMIEASHQLQFQVIDTGIGIAANDLLKLFQPFVQLDSDLNRRYEGTGLGLVLVKGIVELHQGSVSVTSTLGEGSCFVVQIPISQTYLLPP